MQTILQGLEPATADRMLLVCIRFDHALFFKQRKQKSARVLSGFGEFLL
ncbi:hypothetical protein HC022_02350 [Salipiger sp. HF18]|nr:hypothetical protein [Salipiger sp. HF18]NIY95131.1 hypothetical protein [Salipiger sp. HF18]